MISRLLSYPADKLPSRKLMYRSFEAQKEYKLPGGTRNKDRIGKHDYIIKLL